MKLVKIEGEFYNLDFLISASFHEASGELQLTFAAPAHGTAGGDTRTLRVEGDAAADLLRWLEANLDEVIGDGGASEADDAEDEF